MKNYFRVTVLLFSFLFVVFSISAVYAAQGGGNGGGAAGSSGGSGGATSVGQGDQTRTQDRDRIQDPTTHEGDEPDQDRIQLRDRDQIQIFFSTTSPAANISSLRNMIQVREINLERLASSSDTTSSSTLNLRLQNLFRNENRVASAVQVLLDSKNLLGGIGPQVSQIAMQLGNSMATTTAAERNTLNRSFLERLFLGGDKKSADIINGEIQQNQERITEIQRIINANTSISSELRTILQAQIQLLQQEQERLANLVKKESNQWGIFSWRLNSQ